MCGIVGIVGKTNKNNGAFVRLMAEQIKHRGPDAKGFFSESINDVDIDFGHLRLSIIDTTDNANQPMISNDGNLVIVYNGEIYNYITLKERLNSISRNTIIWRTNSDTEVLLTAISILGLKETLEFISGMFAFALFDKQLNRFYLVRDRFGEKPLYYTIQNDTIYFTSELKSFKALSCISLEVDFENAANYLSNGVIQGTSSIYKNVYKIQPGTYLSCSISSISDLTKIDFIEYWSLKEIVQQGKSNIFQGSYEEAKIALEKILIEIIKEHAISDVPYGAFLSGGIDSSLVCAIMKKHVNTSLTTFSIGMPYPGNNEANFAREVASFIGTNHIDKYLEIEEVKNRINEIIQFWDEPFADSSQIPTFFVSELAKKKVTVALSGDGADEFFYGYTTYRWYKNIKMFNFLYFLKIRFFLNLIVKAIPNISNLRFYKKAQSLLAALEIKSLRNLNIYWRDKFRGFKSPVKYRYKSNLDSNLEDDFDYAGYYDALSYLTDDILVKVDRASMSVSLESRAPFLDKRLIEFIVRLPDNYKYSNGISKRILKDILYKYVPEKMVNRPKQGFAVPIDFWLRNELYEWANNIICNISPESEFWDKETIIKFWSEHTSSKYDHGERLWSIIILEIFLMNHLSK